MNQITPSQQDFPLSYDGYAAFDATSLKSLMQKRLLDNGVFTDQIFEGSNFNNLLDVVAYSYNVLLFYLNQTSNESLFSNSTIYENMNKIVKILNYKPVGPQTSILNFQATATSGLGQGVYTIPRFSYFTINDIFYSFTKDLTFIKSNSGVETLNELSDFSFLYQGKYIEYPIYISTGENFEEINIVSVDRDNNNDTIDYHNIFVFVRDGSGRWQEWRRVENIFLEQGDSSVFEVRLNENQRYTVKLGNNVTGKKLNSGNLVAIYFLRSDKKSGEVGPETLNSNNLFFYNTEQYNIIMNDIRPFGLKTLELQEAENINFTNANASIPYSDLEDTNDIRSNAPNFYKRQGRLVTTDDIEGFVKNNYSNVLSDIKVVNNWEYTDGHLRYLYNIGLDKPSLDSRVLFNQVNFADSCNFNNIYIYGVPKTLLNNEFNFTRAFLGAGIKDFILSSLNDKKISTMEVIFQDPVYFGVGFGAASQTEIFNSNLTLDILKESKLVIVKNNNNLVSDSEVKRKVISVILDYFSFANTKLGQLIDFDDLVKRVYSLGDIERIFTTRNKIIMPGINLLGFNPVYNNSKEDINIITQNTQLPYYKIPFWYDVTNIKNYIEITDSDRLQAGIREF